MHEEVPELVEYFDDDDVLGGMAGLSNEALRKRYQVSMMFQNAYCGTELSHQSAPVAPQQQPLTAPTTIRAEAVAKVNGTDLSLSLTLLSLSFCFRRIEMPRTNLAVW